MKARGAGALGGGAPGAGGRRGGPPGKKRPAAAGARKAKKPGVQEEQGIDLEAEAAKRWDSGFSATLHRLDPRRLEGGSGLVVPDGTYYHRPVQVAGTVTSVMMSGGSVHLKLKPTGTSNEELLKLVTGQPQKELRCHVCPPGCNQEEVAEDMVHVRVGRPMKAAAEEEAWVRNLEKGDGQEEDELALLRTRATPGDRGAHVGADEKMDEDKKDAKKKANKEKKVKKKEKKEVSKKKKKGSSQSREESTEEEVRLDGTRPKQANQKKPQLLFGGTGLDPKDRIRNRVARRARRHLRRKSERSSSSDTGSDGRTSISEDGEKNEETLFEQASKVRKVAEMFPGALASQAMGQMRSSLLQEVGYEDRPNVLYPVAVAYLRQHLQRRASGPILRELLTLSHSLDLLLKGKVSSAADTMVQRIKSIEQSLTGSHWSIAQRLEVLPPDSVTLTAVPEAVAAQKEIYEESKARWYASMPEGKGISKGDKGRGKGRGDGKDRFGQHGDGGKKGAKGGGRGEPPKKKE